MAALVGAYPWAFVVVVALILVFVFSVVWLVLSKKGRDDEVVIRLFPKPEITIGRVPGGQVRGSRSSRR
ncbi:hypothetical protein [Saccharothrix xinjiangensis]|uniref:Uncharacterized protein n=1 Tax=Saccharothrix xinjiangensis TaxID=204798 RepID=A0ABV9XVQ1_9PSEU